MKTLDYLHLNAQGMENVIASLQQLLADYQVFYTNLRGLHWNIKGRAFFVLHAKFEEYYEDAATKVDELAERILMLGGVPENRFSEYLKQARLTERSGISCADEAIRLVPQETWASARLYHTYGSGSIHLFAFEVNE